MNLATKPFPRCELGDLVAEADADLRSHYVETQSFQEAHRLDARKYYFVGRKGSGKSAIIQMIHDKTPRDHIIDIRSNDMDSELAPFRSAFNALDLPMQRLCFRCYWGYALMSRIFEVCGIQWSPDGRTEPQKAFDSLRRQFPIQSKPHGLILWARELTGNIQASFEKYGIDFKFQLGTKTPPSLSDWLTDTEVIRHIQLVLTAFGDLIRDRNVYVLIDDLDSGWRNEELQNEYLAALFGIVEKLGRHSHIKFVIALRLDILKNLRMENLDKSIQHMHRLTWDTRDLQRVIEARLHRALDEPVGRIRERFRMNKRGEAGLVSIIEHCFPHPRDVIWTFQQLVYEASRRVTAYIDESLATSVLRGMSTERVRWLCNEWSTTYPWLAQGLIGFRDGPKQYSVADLDAQLSKRLHADISTEILAHALLTVGMAGLKQKPKGLPEYYFGADPPAYPFQGYRYFELHPAVSEAIRTGV